MEPTRRAILAAGATAFGTTLGTANDAMAAGTQIQSVPALQASNIASAAALRLITYSLKRDPALRTGIVLDNGRVVDIARFARRNRLKLAFDPSSMISLIASGNIGLEQVQFLEGQAGSTRNSTMPDVNDVILTSPVPRPQSNIYAVGWNYLEHFEEGKAARADKAIEKYPENPVFFTKGVHTMNGPFETIPFDATNSPNVDWEAELAVVIGKKGRNIAETDAMNHVFGFAAYNDTTLRDVQQKRHGGQWFKGKSLDGHGPMGPWIVTAGGVKLESVRIICRVNGVEKQNGSYNQMFFKIPRIIAELSRGLTLEPGDIIATGTPPGVGYSRTPPEFLKPGDVMETEVTGIGTIRNTIKAEG